MAKAVSEKSLVVLNLLKENADANVTATDISVALGGDDAGFGVKTVNGVVTAGLQRKGLTQRIPASVEVTDEEGNTKVKEVKFIKLTDEGMAYDHDAAVAEDEAEKAAKAAAKDAE